MNHCKFFLKNKCTNTNCKFKHDEEYRRKYLSKFDCKFHKLNKCNNKDCPYNHDFIVTTKITSNIKTDTSKNNSQNENSSANTPLNITNKKDKLSAKTNLNDEKENGDSKQMEPEPEPEPEAEVEKIVNENKELTKEQIEEKIKKFPNYKTKLCINYQKNKTCKNGFNCNFAHGLEELRYQNIDYQTKLDNNKELKEFIEFLKHNSVTCNTNYMFNDIVKSEFKINFNEITNMPDEMDDNLVDFYNIFGEPIKQIEVNNWKILSFHDTNYNFKKYNNSKIFNIAINNQLNKLISYHIVFKTLFIINLDGNNLEERINFTKNLLDITEDKIDKITFMDFINMIVKSPDK